MLERNAGPGAGLWFDLGPHLIDQALDLLGLPTSANASFAVMREGGATDDWAHVQLNYDHVRVILHATLLASGGSPRTLIHGTRGSWVKHGADVQEAQLMKGILPSSPKFGDDPDPGILLVGSTGERSVIAVPRGNQRLFYVGVRDAMLSEKVAPAPMRDALATMAVLEASFASGVEGRTILIPLTANEKLAWQ